MNRVADDLLLQSLERQEDFIHAAADAVDVKAGLILATAAFLALQPVALLLFPKIDPDFFWAQMASFTCLLVASGFTHAVLRITEYESPGFDETWRDQQIAAAREWSTEEDVRKTILWGLIEQAKVRVKVGRQRNEAKLVRLKWARIFISSSFVLNAITIAGVIAIRFVSKGPAM